jgi:hypothetical protein
LLSIGQDLTRQINAFVDNYNQHLKPFKWTATAASILAKLERICKVVNGTQHQPKLGGLIGFEPGLKQADRGLR